MIADVLDRGTGTPPIKTLFECRMARIPFLGKKTGGDLILAFNGLAQGPWASRTRLKCTIILYLNFQYIFDSDPFAGNVLKSSDRPRCETNSGESRPSLSLAPLGTKATGQGGKDGREEGIH